MKFVILMFTITLSACVPVIIQRYNIEFLEHPNLKIINFGKRDLDNPILQFAVPLEYELNRDNYSVHLMVDGVMVYTKATNHESNLLQLKGDPKFVEKSETEIGCHVFGLIDSVDGLSPRTKILVFTWVSYYEECFSKDDTKVLSFSMLDERGNIVGTESLPFEVVTRELTWEYDAL